MSFYQGPTLGRHSWQSGLVAEINESRVGDPSCGDETWGFSSLVFVVVFGAFTPFCKKAKWDN